MTIERQWKFVADMNHSGSITISDFWLWVKWLYFWPGDAVIVGLIQNAPALAAFFELTPARIGGPVSLFLSFPLWIAAIVLLVLIWRLLDRMGARASEAVKRPFLRKQ